MTTQDRAGQLIVIFGGRSDIGGEVALLLAAGNRIILAQRAGGERPHLVASELNRRGALSVDFYDFNATDMAQHGDLIDSIEAEHGPIHIAVMAFGILGDHHTAVDDSEHVREILTVDFLAQASLLTDCAVRMKRRGTGTLIAFSSVAGVRVRQANYVYGSAKAGIDGFASGLADSLHGTGVRVIIARPGFVIGSMTTGMDPAPFSSTPRQVAKAVVDALENEHVVDIWIPWQLRVLFAGLRVLPRAVWRKMPR